MKKNKGFTLIELLAVITLIGLLSLLVVPTIINGVNRNKAKFSETTTQLIYSAAGLYLDANQTVYPKITSSIYCISLQEISDANFLEENLTDINTNEKIDLNYIVESKYNGYKYEYEILTTADACHENVISKDASIAITSMTFYRDSVSETNKTEKLLKGYKYIIDVKVHTANISNGTSLDFVTKKYNEKLHGEREHL